MIVDLAPAQEEFDRLPVTIKARVRDVMQRLELWPEVSGVKALRGDLAGYFRARTGDYRIIFSVDQQTEIVTIHRVGHRSEIYEE